MPVLSRRPLQEAPRRGNRDGGRSVDGPYAIIDTPFEMPYPDYIDEQGFSPPVRELK